MVYVKVDSDGNVLEFPYRFEPFLRTVPEDARPVDTELQKIPTKWYEGLWYDHVERQGDTYVVFFKKGLRKFADINEKKHTLSTLVNDARERNAQLLKNSSIEQSVFDHNKQILDSINIDDESTYDLYDTIKL